jgi:hypothetical protein
LINMTSPLLWIDHEHDRTSASDGVSRYGAYLRQRAAWFRDLDTPAQFAATAWRVATSPVMTPGLVRVRPDLGGVTLGFDEAGEGILRVTVRVPLTHRRLRGANDRLGYPVADWHIERTWDPDGVRYEEPRASRNHAAVLVTAAVIIPINTAHLPHLDIEDCDPVDHTAATRAVLELVTQINKNGGPLVGALREER